MNNHHSSNSDTIWTNLVYKEKEKFAHKLCIAWSLVKRKTTKMLHNACPKKLSFRDTRRRQWRNHDCLAVACNIDVAEDRLETGMRCARSYIDPIKSEQFEAPRLGYPVLSCDFGSVYPPLSFHSYNYCISIDILKFVGHLQSQVPLVLHSLSHKIVAAIT